MAWSLNLSARGAVRGVAIMLPTIRFYPLPPAYRPRSRPWAGQAGHPLPLGDCVRIPEMRENLQKGTDGRMRKLETCLRDLPTPAEARATRRREPLRRRQGGTFRRLDSKTPIV
jgi:hypothetical protein